VGFLRHSGPKRRKVGFFTSLFLVLYLLPHSILTGQNKPLAPGNTSCYLNHIVDSVCGVSDKLLHGPIYANKISQAEGHPFYYNSYPAYSALYLGEDTYYNELFKYDIVSGRLIIKKPISQYATVEVLLQNYLIDSFLIDTAVFIKASHVFSDDSPDGFLERIISGGITLYVKYRKEYRNVRSGIKPFGEYRPLEPMIFMKHHNMIINISGRGDFIDLFGPNKKYVRKYMRKNKMKYSDLSNSGLVKLFAYCGQFL